jgi:DNA invertase Pin-like site-specific DNA recombinase
MLRTIQNDDVVIIKDVARLSRSADQCMYLVEQIQDAGARLEIINI